MGRKAILLCILMLIVGVAGGGDPVRAVQPGETLSDPKLEARAREISAGLRCLVCQNQSIDDSDAPLAGDLRRLVRERIEAGDSNAAVVDYVVARYGDFVLLKPPFKASTLVLWLSPLVILAGGLWLARRVSRGQAAPSGGAALSRDEQARLDALLSRPTNGDGEA